MTPEPFDRRLRRLRRDRAASRFRRVAALRGVLADEIAARLAERGRRFARALDLGCADGGWRLPAGEVVRVDAGFRFARAAGGAQADEDRLPFGAGTFDLIASAGALQGVNDLPGALAQLRRALRPGGLFVAAFPGGDTLGALRRALFTAEEAVAGGVRARTHPMVDPREMPGLMQRAGFSEPVVDVDTVTLRYAGLEALARDLRDGGENGLLRAPPMGRTLAAAAAAAFAALADADGRVSVTAQVIHCQGAGT